MYYAHMRVNAFYSTHYLMKVHEIIICALELEHVRSARGRRLRMMGVSTYAPRACAS
jgi:hypothetical protein